jgi:putative transposase
MKILMLTDVFFPDTIGGAGRVAYHLSHQLCKRAHEVHVLTRNPEGKLPSHEKIEANLFAHRFKVPAKERLLFGLEPEYITPYSPEQNGAIERSMRTLKEERIRLNSFTLFRGAKSPIESWIEAHNTDRPH